MEKRMALQKDIDRRLALIEVKVDSPADQQFLMPFNSPFYMALIKDNHVARRFPGQ